MQQIVSGSDLLVGAGERAVAGAAQAVTENVTSASLTDTITTVLFFAAVAALSAITLGVCVMPITLMISCRRTDWRWCHYSTGAVPDHHLLVR